MVQKRLGNCTITSARKPPVRAHSQFLWSSESTPSPHKSHSSLSSPARRCKAFLSLRHNCILRQARYAAASIAETPPASFFQFCQRRLQENLIIEPFKRSRCSTRSQLRKLPKLARTTHEDPDLLWGLVVQVDTAGSSLIHLQTNGAGI